MKLSILERIVAVNPTHPILPDEGYAPMLRIRANLIEKIGLTAEEFKEYDVRHGEDGVGLLWREDLPQEMEVDLTPAEHALLGEWLAKLEATGKLRVEQLSLHDKFVENGSK